MQSLHLLDAPRHGPVQRHRVSGRYVQPARIPGDFLAIAKPLHELLAVRGALLDDEQLVAQAAALGLNRRAVSKRARSSKPLDMPLMRSCAHEYAWLARRPIIVAGGLWQDAPTREAAEAYADSLDARANAVTEAATWMEASLAAPPAQLTCKPHRRRICRALLDRLPGAPIGVTAAALADQLNEAQMTTSDFSERGRGVAWNRDNVRDVVRYLRSRGARICSDPDDGYWLGDEDECRAFIAAQRERVAHIREHADFIRDAAAFTFPRTAEERERALHELVSREHSRRWKKLRDREGRQEACEKALEEARRVERDLTPELRRLEAATAKGHQLSKQEQGAMRTLREARQIVASRGRRPAGWGKQPRGPYDPLLYRAA